MDIYENTELVRFLEKKFGEVSQGSGGVELRINCPFCQGNKKLWINQEKKIVHCFKCEYGSRLNHFMQKLGEKFEDIFNNDPILATRSWDRKFEERIEDVFKGVFLKRNDDSGVVTLPENYVPLYERLSKEDIVGAARYLRCRGVSDSDIIKHKIGYCIRGMYAWRIIIPVYMEGNLVYYTGRWFAQRQISKKYLNPAIKKNSVIFNYDSIKEGSQVVICEGMFDAMKGGDGYIAILGKAMSTDQKRLLYRKKPSSVVVFLDPDAEDQAMNLAKELSSFFPCSVVTGHNTDAGSMSMEQVHEHVGNAKSLNITNMVSSIIRRPRV